MAARRILSGTRRTGDGERAGGLAGGGDAAAGHRAEPVAARRPLDRIELAVDAELGIVLRCDEILDGRPLRVTELADVRVDIAPAGDDAPFRPPGGWDSVDDDSGPPMTPGSPTPNGAAGR